MALVSVDMPRAAVNVVSRARRLISFPVTTCPVRRFTRPLCFVPVLYLATKENVEGMQMHVATFILFVIPWSLVWLGWKTSLESSAKPKQPS